MLASYLNIIKHTLRRQIPDYESWNNSLRSNIMSVNINSLGNSNFKFITFIVQFTGKSIYKQFID